jgi:hypothetical protein
MKIDHPPALSCLGLTLSLVFGAYSAPNALCAEPNVVPAQPPAAAPATPTSAALIRSAYLALIEKSIAPPKPVIIAKAALEAISAVTPGREPQLPPGFGVDAERDATWLGERVADLPAPWPVIEAMARSAETPHTAFTTPQRRQGIGALMSGKPLCSPGFNLYRLADGRFVVFDVVPGASAQLSGLQTGDVLLRIDQKKTVAVDPFFLSTLAAGTEVALDIERANQQKSINLRLVKAEVPQTACSTEVLVMCSSGGFRAPTILNAIPPSGCSAPSPPLPRKAHARSSSTCDPLSAERARRRSSRPSVTETWLTVSKIPFQLPSA